MSIPSQKRRIGPMVIIVLIVLAIAAIAYVVTNPGGGAASVPDRTNDELEVAPS